LSRKRHKSRRELPKSNSAPSEALPSSAEPPRIVEDAPPAESVRMSGPRLVALLVLVAGTLLIFANLGNRYLWSDEAETALLARNILTYGVPKAFDGKNVISQELGRDYDSNYVWRWTPWLSKYVTAASFAVLGEGTLSARLPFAILGVASLVSLYLLALRIFKDPWTAVLATAFLALSVPFLLYVRQCRYYSVAILASIWSHAFLFSLLERRRWAGVGLGVGLTVLFHSNYMIFAVTIVSFALSVPAFYFRRDVLWRGARCLVVAFLVNLPGFFFFDVFGKSGAVERLYSVATNLGKYYSSINQFAFPLLALVLFLIVLADRRKRGLPGGPLPPRPFFFLLSFAVAFVGLLSLAPWYFFRYVVGLLPVFALLLAFMCRTTWSWNRVAGAIATVMLLFTGIFHTLSAYPFKMSLWEQIVTHEQSKLYTVYFPLYNYLYEITHDFDGPIEKIVGLLREQARPSDRVVITYGDLPLKFYTDLQIHGGQAGEDPERWGRPDWVVVRGFFRFGDRPAMKADAERMRTYLAQFRQGEYVLVDIDLKDVFWENIPEPDYHRFRTATQGRRVMIWRRASR
jgi:4-amino-4-deoxy-L-arabinose transferase-like glycosyltransferase